VLFSAGLQSPAGCINFQPMKQVADRADGAWRKSRLAARLLIRKESRPLRPREQMLARRLSQDSEVTNRLIQQALYFLGVGPRKHAFDKKLVDGRN
jgi:hypothetical protein